MADPLVIPPLSLRTRARQPIEAGGGHQSARRVPAPGGLSSAQSRNGTITTQSPVMKAELAAVAVLRPSV